MARLVSFTATAIIAGAIGFGFGVYAEPSEQADQFRSVIRRALDAIDANLRSDEAKPDIRSSENQPVNARSEIVTPSVDAPAPAEAADHGSAAPAPSAPVENDNALRSEAAPAAASAEAAPPAAVAAPTTAPTPEPAPSPAPAAKKTKPKAAAKPDKNPN